MNTVKRVGVGRIILSFLTRILPNARTKYGYYTHIYPQTIYLGTHSTQSIKKRIKGCSLACFPFLMLTKIYINYVRDYTAYCFKKVSARILTKHHLYTLQLNKTYTCFF